MGRLIALDLPGGPDFVDELRRAWADGDAVLPVDRRLPPAARSRLLHRFRPAVLVDGDGRHPLTDGVPVRPGDALVMASSGTTGSPKGVVLTHDAVAASAHATSEALDVRSDVDRWLACLPLNHVGGLAVICRALVTGTAVEVHDGFDADAVEAAASGGATLTSLVPTALGRIDPTLFRTIIVGGSAVPADRPPNVTATYGLTETGSGCVYDGRPLRDVELRIVDGEVLVRGPMLFRAYRHVLDADGTERADPDGWSPIDGDGWFATGDLGTLAADGTLSISGRADELIITGGENVWPGPVERCLARHPAVADVAVVGRPDLEWGQVVTAVVVAAAGVSRPGLDEVRDHVRTELPAFAAPRAVEWVDALPRTALGKLRRHLI